MPISNNIFERVDEMKLKVVGIVIVLILMIGVVYTQLMKPLTMKPEKVDASVWYVGYESIEKQAEDINNGMKDDTMTIHSFNGKLPSNNPDDYMTIYFNVAIKNRSLFNISPIEAVVYELGSHKENVLFSYSSSAGFMGRALRFTSTVVTFPIHVYVKGMDEQAIEELIKDVKAKVVYKGDFIGTKEQIIDFSKCKNIKISFEDEDKNE